MNVHVRRAAARHRAEWLRSFCAAVCTALLFGLFLGHVSHAQDFTPPISNGQFQANSASTATGASSQTGNIFGIAGQWTYLCGWVVYSNGATAAQTANITVGPVAGNAAAPPQTFNYPQALAAGVLAAGVALVVSSDKYWPCLRSAAQGANISVTVPQAVGNTTTLLNLYGFTGQ